MLENEIREVVDILNQPVLLRRARIDLANKLADILDTYARELQQREWLIDSLNIRIAALQRDNKYLSGEMAGQELKDYLAARNTPMAGSVG